MEDVTGDASGLVQGTGCSRCRETGFSGRVGMFEMLEPNDAVNEALITGGSHREILDAALAGGFQGMRIDGLHKAADGLTTVEEVVAAAAA